MASLLIKGALIIACGILWRLGGKAGWSKLWRRIGCPLIIGTAAILARNWFGLISIPFLGMACSIGYGENSSLMKWIGNKYLVRLICGLAYSFASTAILWSNWWLLGFHIAVVSVGVMLAGNQKFQFEDEREEFFIGILVGLCPIM